MHKQTYKLLYVLYVFIICNGFFDFQNSSFCWTGLVWIFFKIMWGINRKIKSVKHKNTHICTKCLIIQLLLRSNWIKRIILPICFRSLTKFHIPFYKGNEKSLHTKLSRDMHFYVKWKREKRNENGMFLVWYLMLEKLKYEQNVNKHVISKYWSI